MHLRLRSSAPPSFVSFLPAAPCIFLCLLYYSGKVARSMTFVFHPYSETLRPVVLAALVAETSAIDPLAYFPEAFDSQNHHFQTGCSDSVLELQIQDFDSYYRCSYLLV